MKTLIRIALTLVLFSSIGFAIFLLHSHKEKESWALIVGLLAVVAAAIGALPALRLLELQEDALRPRPTPYFDLTSRHNLLQLRVRNLGSAVAYNVQLSWSERLVDYKGNEITSLDSIAVLLPQESVSVLVGSSHDTVKKLGDARFQGTCSFRDSSGKKFREHFVCSLDGDQKRLLFDSEMPKTLHDIQDIPTHLSDIADSLKELLRNQSRSSDEEKLD